MKIDPKWASRKLAVAVLGMAAIVGALFIAAYEVGATPAVAAAVPSIAGIVSIFIHRQGKLDELPQ